MSKVGRKSKYDELYNPVYKQRFLDQYEEEGTKYNYRQVLGKCYRFESERFGKDVSEFNHEELDNLFYNLQAGSYESLVGQVSIITSYISFAIQEGFSRNNINFATLSSFHGKNLMKYVDKTWQEKRIMSREDIYDEIITDCINAQDAAIYSLYFEGVSGEGAEEIINLKRDDINKTDNILTLTKNDGTTRALPVPEECINILVEASEQKKYERTLFVESNNTIDKAYTLVDNEHVLRPTIRSNGIETLRTQAVRERFNKVKKYQGNSYITPTSVRLSGMIDYAKQYMEESGVETLDDLQMDYYKRLYERFGISESLHYATRGKLKKYI